MQPRIAPPDAPRARTERAPGIWIADAARALTLLHPDAASATEIVQLLGLVAAPVDRTTVTPLPPMHTRPQLSVPEPTRPATPIRSTPEPPAGDPGPIRRPAVVEPLPPRATTSPPVRMPELSEVLRPPAAASPLPPADLLPPSRQRAILSAVVGTTAPGGELDVVAIVETVVAGRPLLTLPQLYRTTTRRGLHLLVDLGPAMTPFDRDQKRARQAIEQVAGPDGLQVLCFRGSPLEDAGAGSGPIWEWRPWLPPATPRPIVIVSDLGLLTPEGFHPDWRRFAQLCREARCPVVALVPVPADRVPADVRRVLAIVPWDRAATVRDGATAARRAARGERRRP